MKEQKEKITSKEAKELLSRIKNSMFKKKVYLPKRYSGSTSLQSPGGLNDIIGNK